MPCAGVCGRLAVYLRVCRMMSLGNGGKLWGGSHGEQRTLKEPTAHRVHSSRSSSHEVKGCYLWVRGHSWMPCLQLPALLRWHQQRATTAKCSSTRKRRAHRLPSLTELHMDNGAHSPPSERGDAQHSSPTLGVYVHDAVPTMSADHSLLNTTDLKRTRTLPALGTIAKSSNRLNQGRGVTR